MSLIIMRGCQSGGGGGEGTTTPHAHICRCYVKKYIYIFEHHARCHPKPGAPVTSREWTLQTLDHHPYSSYVTQHCKMMSP